MTQHPDMPMQPNDDRTPDLNAELDRLAARIPGGQVRAITTDAHNRGTVEIVDPDGHTWRVTFTGPIDAFRADGYTPLDDDQVVGATIIGALWDDTWLIEATQDARLIHLRLAGELIRLEAVRRATPLLTYDELRHLLEAPITLDGQSTIPLAPMASCQDAADALTEVLDAMEEAYHDDFLAPDDPTGADERRRLRALRLAIDLLTLLTQRS